MTCIALLQTDRQHVAMRGVQDGVFGKIHQDGETMALTAAENDEIHSLLFRNAENFRLGVAAFDSTRGIGESQARDESGQLRARAIDQLVLELCGWHQ